MYKIIEALPVTRGCQVIPLVCPLFTEEARFTISLYSRSGKKYPNYAVYKVEITITTSRRLELVRCMFPNIFNGYPNKLHVFVYYRT